MLTKHSLLFYLGIFIFCLPSLASTPQPVIYVLDTSILNELEKNGYSLNQTLDGSTPISQTAELYQSSPYYKSFADAIGRPLQHDKKTDQLPNIIPPNSGDIPDMVRSLRGFEDKGARSDKDLKGGFFIHHLANNSQYPYEVERDGDEPRHFDTRWLNSNYGYMKLIAIANRMDRNDITRDSCGEVRFIYRLSYTSKKSSSSLPFFVNVVHEYPKRDSCADFAKTWQLPVVNASTLKNGPLKNLSFRQLEVNFQSLRFTSGYMHDFGGQAMYMQRIFRKSNARLEPVALENTPDVLAIEKDPSLLKRFVEYLKKPENLRELDQGILNISFDPKFLSKISVSWSTLGRARTANRPFAKIFGGHRDLVESIDISKLKYIKSHEALIERLDNLTCMGCHQSGGTAGFQMLGLADPAFSHPFNRQELALSPHASAEIARRVSWVSALADGKRPNPFRPHSTFPSAKWDLTSDIPSFDQLRIGHLCIAEPGTFASAPTCGDPNGRSVECRKTVTTAGKTVLLGECTLKEPREAAGSVCWMGEIQEDMDTPPGKTLPSFNFYAFQDKWKLKEPVISDRKQYTCVLPQSGAPLGRMSRRCSLAEENFEISFDKGVPNELCANQGGVGFDMCAASGDSGACLETKVARAMLDTCDTNRSCREDYICQKFPDYQKISAADYIRKKEGQLINLSRPEKINGMLIEEARRRGIGFCVPTYFLFNMRLDGHPSPVTGLPPRTPKYDRSQPLRGYK
ncbi:MAG: hypothetical protein ACXVBQ_06470 [Pseudobdellovibrionaceae bacterium]